MLLPETCNTKKVGGDCILAYLKYGIANAEHACHHILVTKYLH